MEITDSPHNFAENNTIAFNEGYGVRIEGGGGRTGVVVCANPILSNAIFSSPSGTDEGKTLLGQKTVKTDGTGNASFIFSAPAVPVGQNVTATATREFTLDTSEFSNPRTIKDAAAPRSRG